MPDQVAVMDTGVLCCWLEVPGKERANSGGNQWNNRRANEEIDRVIADGGTIILPNSVIVETARFISQAPHSRRTKAIQLLDRAISSLRPESPWKKFDEHERLWTIEWYERAREQWPDLAARKVSLTDFSLIWIVKYFRDIGIACELLTTEDILEAEVAAIRLKKPDRQRPRR